MLGSIVQGSRLAWLAGGFLLLAAVPSPAAMINISESVIGSGTFGGSVLGSPDRPIAFTNQLVTISAVYDTDNVTEYTSSTGPTYSSFATQAVVSVAGVGSGVPIAYFHTPGSVYVDSATNQIQLGIGFLTAGVVPFTLSAPFFGPYNLQSTFAPVAVNVVAFAPSVPTSFGSLQLTSTAATGSIAASAALVPEPMSFVLLGAGLLLIGGAGVRRRVARRPAASQDLSPA